jgi:hypothetical protein
MTRLSIAGLLMFAALLSAPHAAADPEDLEPYCTSGQVPESGECLPQPDDVYIDDGPGPGIRPGRLRRPDPDGILISCVPSGKAPSPSVW